ncbi:MAG: sensor histidine kinase [Kofleriaceae bacterium]|nr:sensor histidine kinase [Kofleriaceae bacterium]
MRRLLLVNALIFAVLAAAVTLVYYGYSYASSLASRDREQGQAMHEIAEEKVLNIEALILREDADVFAKELSLEAYLDKLPELARKAHIRSVFVLDEHRKVLLDGSWSRAATVKEGVAFRDWFEKTVLPELPLADPSFPANTRDHVHRVWAGPAPWGGKHYLFSFMRKVQGDRTYYVVIEEDLVHLLDSVFRQYFPDVEKAKYVYQVTDANGKVWYGPEFLRDTDVLSVSVPFSETVDQWFARVSEKDLTVREQLQRKRMIESLVIGGAITVILVGFVFILLAIRRERRANELKSEFISNVSHELKTPLSIITMFGEMLANGRTKGPEQSTEYAEIIWRESVRLGRLIDNVLDFAKIERGKGVYDFAEADIADVVERAVDLVQRRLATASMTIDVDIEPELPHVKLDANAFTLAVMNLIDNAIKYASDGKKVELRLARATKAEERIELTVRDFGPGIDPEEQQQIFERFYRARAVRLKPIRGSGIGLALVRHIARAHGGDVEVASVPGQGSTFRLWLPI